MSPLEAHYLREAAAAIITHNNLWPTSTMGEICLALENYRKLFEPPQWAMIELALNVSDQLLMLQETMS